MRWKATKNLPHLIPFILLALAVFLKLSHAPIATHLQRTLFDSFQQWSPRQYTEQPVKIIDIDDASLEKIGQWPWPRNVLATLVTTLQQSGAAAIALDVVFAEADRTSPKQLQALWPDNKRLQRIAATLPDHDQLFADAISQGNVVTGFVLAEHTSSYLPQQKAGYAMAGELPINLLPSFNGAVLPLPAFEQSASGNGALNSSPDADGVLRKIPLLYHVGDAVYPSLAMEALRVAQGATSYTLKSVGASGEEGAGGHTAMTHVKIGGLEVPVTADGALWVYYTSFEKSRYIPAWEVLQPAFDKARVEGGVVILGTSAAGLKDIRATPLNPVTSGVEVHAQAMEQILSREFLDRPDWMEGAEVLAMLVVGVVLIVLMGRVSALWQAFFTAVVLIAAGAFSWYAYRYLHLLVDPVVPALGVLLLYLSESFRKFLATERERKHIRSAFGHYMSPILVEQLASNPDQLKLGGEMKELTVLFSDIRGFTSISERLDAQALTQFMNRFLTPLTEVILEHNGTIDKYIGDCVMAFWNAPLDNKNHAEDACNAALAMLEAMKAFNREQVQKGGEAIPVQIGIGLNTGNCCVGNMGSEQRFDYSILGDDVNLASRLEGQTKYYGVDIIIGEATKVKLEGMAILELDCIQVKGKAQPVYIYALLGGKALAQNEDFIRLADTMEVFHHYYRAGKWMEAKTQLLACIELAVAADESLPLETVIRLFNERIDHFLSHPPEAGWNGVHVAEAK